MGRLRDDLDREWAILANGSAGADALVGWQRSEPVLAAAGSLAELVAVAHHPDDPTGHEVLRALLRLAASDHLARRCLLQALLPGLVRLCGRYPTAGDDPDERLGHVLTLALERIGQLAGRDVPYPAAAVTWRVGDWLRRAEVAQRRHAPIPTAHVPMDVGQGRSVDEELATFLVDGVRRGKVRVSDAALVYTTRVAGVPCHVLAAERGVDPAALRTRRRRAEHHLAAAVADWC